MVAWQSWLAPALLGSASLHRYELVGRPAHLAALGLGCCSNITSANGSVLKERMNLPLDFVNEVEPDAVRRQFVHRAAIIKIVELRIRLVTVIVENLNDSIVAMTSSE